MRKLALAAIATVLITAVSYGQGTIVFNTRVTGSVDFKAYDVGGTTLLQGTNFTAQLFGGPQGTGESALSPLTPTTVFRTGAGAGWVVAPVDTVIVPGVPENGIATLQMRVWDNRGGTITSYAAAVAANAKYGKSPLFNSTGLGGTLTTPPFLTGLGIGTSMSLVPEPSTFALLGLGALALLIRRRK